jgi:hypothetical protein
MGYTNQDADKDATLLFHAMAGESQAGASPEPGAASTAAAPQSAVPVAPAAPVPQDHTAYLARRAELVKKVERQRQIITQLDQMQAQFGAGAPAAIGRGLAEAQQAFQRLQTELEALQPPAPAIDPAEVEPLVEEVKRQRQIIAYLEHIRTQFGAAAPPAIGQALVEAQRTLAHARSKLSAISASLPAATPKPPLTPVVEAPPAPVVKAPPAPVVEAPKAPAPPRPVSPMPATTTPSQARAAATGTSLAATAKGARLVLDEHDVEFVLPTDKNEVIIGREDPIRGIYPEIDLTSFGGESGGVSRQHARLTHSGGKWTITDLDSTNRTFVDDAEIQPGTAVPLHDGTRLQVGPVMLTFREGINS